jgi:predicted nucleic acid-binding protein
MHYLVLIAQADILPVLFGRVAIPSVVRDELAHDKAPDIVRNWIRKPPAWLELHPRSEGLVNIELGGLDEGEKAALTLAASLGAHLLLLDDREAVRVARRQDFRAIGTLRVLQLAATRGLLDLADSFERLKRTNFRYRQEIMDRLLVGQMGE